MKVIGVGETQAGRLGWLYFRQERHPVEITPTNKGVVSGFFLLVLYLTVFGVWGIIAGSYIGRRSDGLA